MKELSVEEIRELSGLEDLELSKLPKEYWPCALCILTLLEAYSQGKVYHQAAFEALRQSRLVEDWPEEEGLVKTTERGETFVKMILATPLPEQRWVDPREPAQSVSR